MQETPDSSESRTIASVEKSCRIIDSLYRLNGATLTELADEVELTPGTIHPHLITLIENEFVVKKGKEYHTSFRFLTIGEAARRNDVLYNHAKDELGTLANRNGLRVQLYTEEYGLAVCIAIDGGPQSINPTDQEGYRTPMHCIAAGKAMLAEFSTQRVEDIIEARGLTKLTRHTITDKEKLFEELEEIAEQGYAFNDEEYIEGLRAVGATVQGNDGAVLGAISVSAPTKEITLDEFRDTLAHDVESVANRIELNIRVTEE